jgi:hypothetical protein
VTIRAFLDSSKIDPNPGESSGGIEDSGRELITPHKSFVGIEASGS